MKTYTILGSLLALAACGGGSGGTAPTEIARVGTVSQTAAESNANITNMVSEIGVLADNIDGPSINLGRAATGSFIHNGKQYKSYKLDDVELLVGDWGPAQFHVDENGKIDKLVFQNDTKRESDATRQGDSDKFIVRFKDANLSDDERDVKFSYTSFAKELGLSYVDFGTFSGTSPFSGEQVSLPFIAGYDVKQIKNPTGKMEFSGLAKGSVARHTGDHDQDQTTITAKDATLVFENGCETLTANFDKWYTMTVTKDADNIHLDFDATGKTIQDSHKLAETSVDNADIKMTTKYYGNAADIKEATALINYQQFDDPDTDDNVNVTFGFGGKEVK